MAEKPSLDRGRRAPASGSGVVHGSGAGAGGGNPGEDYDSDPIGGGGEDFTPRARRDESAGHDTAPTTGRRRSS